MPKVISRVEFDEEVLRRVDAAALELGRSRAEVIEDSVKRAMAARTLEELLARVRDRSNLTEQQASDLAASERAAVRANRQRAGQRAAER